MTFTFEWVTVTPTKNITPRGDQLVPIDFCLVSQCSTVRIDTLRSDYASPRKAIRGKTTEVQERIFFTIFDFTNL